MHNQHQNRRALLNIYAYPRYNSTAPFSTNSEKKGKYLLSVHRYCSMAFSSTYTCDVRSSKGRGVRLQRSSISFCSGGHETAVKWSEAQHSGTQFSPRTLTPVPPSTLKERTEWMIPGFGWQGEDARDRRAIVARTGWDVILDRRASHSCSADGVATS